MTMSSPIPNPNPCPKRLALALTLVQALAPALPWLLTYNSLYLVTGPEICRVSYYSFIPNNNPHSRQSQLILLVMAMMIVNVWTGL